MKQDLRRALAEALEAEDKGEEVKQILETHERLIGRFLDEQGRQFDRMMTLIDERARIADARTTLAQQRAAMSAAPLGASHESGARGAGGGPWLRDGEEDGPPPPARRAVPREEILGNLAGVGDGRGGYIPSRDIPHRG